jgi:hypothetical protein
VVGDTLYGGCPATPAARAQFPLALRAVHLRFRQPFTHQMVTITAPTETFISAFGFLHTNLATEALKPPSISSPTQTAKDSKAGR